MTLTLSTLTRDKRIRESSQDCFLLLTLISKGGTQRTISGNKALKTDDGTQGIVALALAVSVSG